MNKINKINYLKYMINHSKGFSLIEILISLALLAGAGTFVAGKIFDQLHEGKIKSAKIQMSNLADRLKEFRRHCGFYPGTEAGLDALVSKPSGRDCKRYNPDGYIEGGRIPDDPWDEPYAYVSTNGKKFNIYSLGADNEEGGEDKDADIYLYEEKK